MYIGNIPFTRPSCDKGKTPNILLLFFDLFAIIKQQRLYCDFIDVRRCVRACRKQTMLATTIARLGLSRRPSRLCMVLSPASGNGSNRHRFVFVSALRPESMRLSAEVPLRRIQRIIKQSCAKIVLNG